MLNAAWREAIPVLAILIGVGILSHLHAIWKSLEEIRTLIQADFYNHGSPGWNLTEIRESLKAIRAKGETPSPLKVEWLRREELKKKAGEGDQAAMTELEELKKKALK